MAEEQNGPVSVADVDENELQGKWVRRRGGERYRFAGYTYDTFGLNDVRCAVLYDNSTLPRLGGTWIVVSESRFESDFTYTKDGDGN